MKCALLLFNFLLAISTIKPFYAESTSQQDDENFYRIYLYFGEVAMQKSLVELEGHFFSYNGESYTAQGSAVMSNGISNGSLDGRIWYMDIPTFAQTCDFYIYDKDGNLWSNTNLYVIDGCTFIYNTKNYVDIDNSTGWSKINITMEQFADYFVSRINTDNPNYTDGFMNYEKINSSVYKNIVDYDSKKEETIRWNDEYLKRGTNLKQKWDIIKSSYYINYKPTDKIIWPYFLGAIILCSSCGVIVPLLVKEIKKRKHEKKSS